MSNYPDNDAYKSQIYFRMDEKDTNELLDIWEENNRAAWTDEAFEAIKAILMKRLGSVPEQEEAKDEEDELLDDEEKIPEKYPNERKLIWIAELAGKLAWIYLGVAVINTLYQFYNFLFIETHPGIFGTINFSEFLQFSLKEADPLIFAVAVYVLMRAVTEIIYLLMDIRVLVGPEESDAEDEVVDPAY